MKKTLLLSLFTLGFVTVNNAIAQKESDLEILIESPTVNQEIDYNESFTFSYKIVNHGDSAIVADDTFYVGYDALGINIPGLAVTGYDIAVGDTSDVIEVTTLQHTLDLSADSTITVCAFLNETLNTVAGITDTNQNNDTACVTVTFKEKPNSIYNNTLAEQINIYPNPTQGNINVSVKGLTAQELNVAILDLTGRVVMSANEKVNTNNFNIELNTQNLSNGIYFVELRAGSEKVVSKFTKQ